MSFLTAYKKVDNFIKDAYSSDSGISTYITVLERGSYQNWYGVCWENTYQQLKHYRYIRNQIVHEDNANEEDLCSKSDICWLEQFYKDLLCGNDPLAQRASIERRVKESAAKTTKKSEPVKTKSNTAATSKREVEIPDENKSERSIFKKISDFFKHLFN